MPATARSILNAIEGGGIQSIKERGTITILVDLERVFTVLAEPGPQVRVTVGNVVQVLSRDEIQISIVANNKVDAEEIAVALSSLIENAA